MSLLEVRNLDKAFGGIRAVQNVSFLLEEGEILGIIGPNGAGKTTIFNLISGAIKPDNGAIFFKSEKITNLKPFEICNKGLARTFQMCRPFHRLSVLDNVLVGALTTTNTKNEAQDRANELLRLIGLEDKRYVLAENLNIVDRKRLELARATATDPKLLLLDEVMSGLTPREINEVLKVVEKIYEKEISLVVIEHVMKIVMTICNRIIVINYGEKIAEGPPQEVAKDPLVIKAYLGEKRSHAYRR